VSTRPTPGGPGFAALVAAAALGLLGCLAPFTACAQGTGANVNFLTPKGLQTFSVSHLQSGSNFRFGQTGFDELDVETNTTGFGYAWRFGLFERLSVVGVGLDYQDIGARAVQRREGIPPIELEGSRRGLGDPRAFLRLGLVGTPALPSPEWRAFDKGFQLSAELGARMPVGDYDERRVLNPGYNRWALDLSLPAVVPLDGARRTTFVEFSPRVVWFGDNTDAPRQFSRLSQDPLYIAEAHASHHLGGRWWFSLGVQYQRGGETFLDGAARNNAIDQWFGEAGLGFLINRHLSVALGYGRIFAADNDAEGEAWRLRLGLIL